MLLITPISFGLWSILSFFSQINFIILVIENFVAMFLTGFGIHYLFNIKSNLDYILGFTKDADGTGILPYARSLSLFNENK